MKNNIRRIFCMALTLILCFSMIPLAAFAEDAWFLLDDGIADPGALSDGPFFETETVSLEDYFENDPLMNGDLFAEGEQWLFEDEESRELSLPEFFTDGQEPFAEENYFEFFMEETTDGLPEDEEASFFFEDLPEDDATESKQRESAASDDFILEELSEDEESLANEQTAFVFYNKMFFDNEDIAAERPDILQDLLYTRTEAPLLAAANAGTVYSDVNAAAQLRNAMVNRKASCSLTVDNSAGEYVDNLCKNIVYMATRHTGNPKEGDYITWQGLAVIVDQPTASGTSVTLNFSMRYVTTAAQEAQVDTAVKNLRSQLGLSGKTDYQKIKAIYDWLTANITYNMSTDITHTAYGAIINKCCCCQGYSQLFYRMMLEEGIDARVVRGTGNGGGHAWNIVRLGTVYYYIDATWDTHLTSEYYSYFLDGADHFTVEHFAWQPSFMGDSLNYDENFLFSSYYDLWYTTLSTGADVTDYAISAAPYSKVGLKASTETAYITESIGATVDLTIDNFSSTSVAGVDWWYASGTDNASVSIKKVSDTKYQVTFSAKNGKEGTGQYGFATYDKNGKYTSNKYYIIVTASSDYYTLTYNFNGGTGEIKNQKSTYEYGTYYVLITNKIPTKTHYRFLCWVNQKNQMITPGTKYVLSGNETLRAEWESTAIQITFDANGGSVSSASKTAYYDDVYGTLPTPSKSGATFSGWYTARSGGEKVTASTNIVRPENHTLYAHWNSGLKITTQPVSKSVAVGKNAVFTVEASGEGLTYQWQYKTAAGTGWSAATASGNKTAKLTVPATVSRDGYSYRCIVKSSDGTKVTSSAAKLTVKPAITTQPTEKTVAVGKKAVFTVAANGNNLTYQWQYKTATGTGWSAATASGNKTETLTVPATVSRDGYSYRCVVTSSNGTKATSSAATLTVKPAITTQPIEKTVAVGMSAVFTVVANGKNLTYQWQYKTASGTNWSKATASGNKTATLTVPGTASRNGYSYRCVVTSSNGTKVTSSAAKLTVK